MSSKLLQSEDFFEVDLEVFCAKRKLHIGHFLNKENNLDHSFPCI